LIRREGNTFEEKKKNGHLCRLDSLIVKTPFLCSARDVARIFSHELVVLCASAMTHRMRL